MEMLRESRQLDGLWLQLSIVLVHLGLVASVDYDSVDPLGCS